MLLDGDPSSSINYHDLTSMIWATDQGGSKCKLKKDQENQKIKIFRNE